MMIARIIKIKVILMLFHDIRVTQGWVTEDMAMLLLDDEQDEGDSELVYKSAIFRGFHRLY